MYIIYRERHGQPLTREFLTQDKSWKDVTYVVFNCALFTLDVKATIKELQNQRKLHDRDWHVGFIQLS